MVNLFKKISRGTSNFFKKADNTATNIFKKVDNGLQQAGDFAEVAARKTANSLEKAAPVATALGNVAGAFVGDPLAGSQIAGAVGAAASMARQGQKVAKTFNNADSSTKAMTVANLANQYAPASMKANVASKIDALNSNAQSGLNSGMNALATMHTALANASQ